MTERLIIAAFGVVSVAIHWFIYQWVKFKMHEGVITNHLENAGHSQVLSSEQIASQTQLSPARVKDVCHKSRYLEEYQGRNELWCLSAK